MSNRRLAGGKALSAGKAFEQSLEFRHEIYSRRGRAWIEHTGTRARAVKRGDDVVFVAGHSMPDYVGVIAPEGRAIVFDAKTSENKYTWSLYKSKIHQRDTLSRWAEFGAIAFFAVEQRPASILYLLRIQPNRFWPAHPKPTLKWSDYEGWTNSSEGDVLKIEGDDISDTYEYLSAIRKFWL